MARAVERLRAGELVGFPTETVYGLGADAANATRCASSSRSKGRPADHPVIVHLRRHGAHRRAGRAKSRRGARARRSVRAGTADADPAESGARPRRRHRRPGHRRPARARHPVARALLGAFGGGADCRALGQSLRPRSRPPRACRRRVRRPLPLILDGGPCDVGIESTIVAFARRAVLLRPGGVRPPRSRRARACAARPDADAPRVSGTLPSHYAPRTQRAWSRRALSSPSQRTAASTRRDRRAGAHAHAPADFRRRWSPRRATPRATRARCTPTCARSTRPASTRSSSRRRRRRALARGPRPPARATHWQPPSVASARDAQSTRTPDEKNRHRPRLVQGLASARPKWRGDCAAALRARGRTLECARGRWPTAAKARSMRSSRAVGERRDATRSTCEAPAARRSPPFGIVEHATEAPRSSRSRRSSASPSRPAWRRRSARARRGRRRADRRAARPRRPRLHDRPGRQQHQRRRRRPARRRSACAFSTTRTRGVGRRPTGWRRSRASTPRRSIRGWRECEITIMSDVNNPLRGSRGATAIFGPQKGVTPDGIARIRRGDRAFRALAEAALGRTAADQPGRRRGGRARLRAATVGGSSAPAPKSSPISSASTPRCAAPTGRSPARAAPTRRRCSARRRTSSRSARRARCAGFAALRRHRRAALPELGALSPAASRCRRARYARRLHREFSAIAGGSAEQVGRVFRTGQSAQRRTVK